MPPAILVLDHVSKSFGPVKAVRDLSLAIDPGQVVALLGPNGAGKTTTLSLMLGLRRPTSGTVRAFGFHPRDRRARSRCGVMLQESAVPASLQVAELVDLFRSYYPDPLPLDDVLEAAGLREIASVQAGRLSGGQKQRLYFGLALCGNPELLFLDEPSVGMDVEMRRGFWEVIRRIAASGRTIVLTTHYLEEADALADRVVLIQHGRVIADDSPRGIKSRLPSRTVRFDADDPARVRTLLEHHPVHLLDAPRGEVHLLSSQPESVLRTLFDAHLELRNLEVGGARLEEAILDLTAARRR
jgi:ABC-2 type transport system ATP-binding protein